MKRRRSSRFVHGWIRHSFPGLPALLLSAADLDCLTLLPVGMLLPGTFRPNFKKADCQSRSTSSVLPSLTRFKFHEVSRYLEDLVVQIDAPLLNQLRETFFP
jgi:hypothetical protein